MYKKTIKNYIYGVKPLTIKNAIIKSPKLKREPPQIQRNSDTQEILLKKSELHVIKRKEKRNFTIDRKIDLHGLTQNESFSLLLDFFVKCQLDGIKKVLVITGGNSIKKSVLRKSFLQWINELLGNYIVSCSPSENRHGGQGAFYVILKNKLTNNMGSHSRLQHRITSKKRII